MAQNKQSELERPAVAGGEPSKKTPWGSEKRYGEEELSELREALEQGTLFYAQGGRVKKMEEEFARRHGVDFAVASSSGTSAIHAAMIAAGVSPGDEVILSPITDMGSIIPVMFQGAVPVFADVDPRNYNLSPESVESLITPQTRAVLAIHLWGNPCDLDALSAICARRGLTLIEDCAQAIGSTYHDRPIGTFGSIGCFSFNEFKHISCGDGGIAITKDAGLARKLRLATDKCYDRDKGAAVRIPYFLANNYRMTELQGAVVLAQLRKLDGIVERRRKWCEALSKAILPLPAVLPPEPTPHASPSWWFYMMRVDPERLGANADEFADALEEEGLRAGAHYIDKCIYEYPMFIDHSAFERGSHAFERIAYRKGMCPTAEKVLETCVVLRVNEAYTQNDLDETIHGIQKVARWFNAGAG